MSLESFKISWTQKAKKSRKKNFSARKFWLKTLQKSNGYWSGGYFYSRNMSDDAKWSTKLNLQRREFNRQSFKFRLLKNNNSRILRCSSGRFKLSRKCRFAEMRRADWNKRAIRIHCHADSDFAFGKQTRTLRKSQNSHGKFEPFPRNFE